jgi:hypothetical protein
MRYTKWSVIYVTDQFARQNFGILIFILLIEMTRPNAESDDRFIGATNRSDL